jgi:hypothetical protein
LPEHEAGVVHRGLRFCSGHGNRRPEPFVAGTEGALEVEHRGLKLRGCPLQLIPEFCLAALAAGLLFE